MFSIFVCLSNDSVNMRFESLFKGSLFSNNILTLNIASQSTTNELPVIENVTQDKNEPKVEETPKETERPKWVEVYTTTWLFMKSLSVVNLDTI